MPADRLGCLSANFSGCQLKIVQDGITLLAFIVFARPVLKERLTWNCAASFACMLPAVYLATAFRPQP